MQYQSIDKYQILEEIASGGQGTVFRAWDTRSGQVVALKVLHPHLASDSAILDRFHREAQLAAAVSHPNITAIYEVGQDGNSHFIAMEFLPDSIHNLIVSTGRLPVDRAVDICHQSAEALEAAHQGGIIHRDIKPQNLLVAPDGTVKVTDFGIARATALSTMTRTGALMGTPNYMSPEQAQGQRVDIRSDIYSLGIVLYQMLTGQLPFEANTPYEVIRQHVEQTPERVRRLRSDIPSTIERIVNQCLEKDPRRRFQTPAELVQALRQVYPNLGSSRRQQPQRQPPQQPQLVAAPERRESRRRERPDTTWMQSWARAWQRAHRNRWAWTLPIIPIIIALSVAAVRLDVVDVGSIAALLSPGAESSEPANSGSEGDFATSVEVVDIPDANLRTEIARILRKPDGSPITAGEMARITRFNAPRSNIRDLSGLEYATNLETLALPGNSVTDTKAIAGLTQLRHLNLGENSIGDLTPLAGLTNMQILDLRNNSISDLSPLSGLINLRALFLDENPITDLSPLVANPGLVSDVELVLCGLPLNSRSLDQHVPKLVNRGVNVELCGPTAEVPATPAPAVGPVTPTPSTQTRAPRPTNIGNNVNSRGMVDPYGLGIHVVDLTPELLDELAWPRKLMGDSSGTRGVYVVDTVPGGLSVRMGIRPRDVIYDVVHIQGIGSRRWPVSKPAEFHELMAEGWLGGEGALVWVRREGPGGVFSDVKSHVLEPSGDIRPVDIPQPLTEERCCILFGELNWESARAQNRIAQYIIEHGFEYPTGLLEGALPPLIDSVRSGEIDVLMEIWLPNQAKSWEEGLINGELIDLGPSLGNDWQNTFVIPRYLQEEYPELDHVNDLTNPRFRALFDADGDGKARLVGCAIGWICHEINQQQIQGYGLQGQVEFIAAENQQALFDSLYNAYENRAPWLGYMWGTAEPALLLDLVRLDEPPYTEQCWSTDKACAFGDSAIVIGAHSTLVERAPEVAEFLRRWTFDVGEYAEVGRWLAESSGSSLEEAALFWLNANGSLWNQWVPADVARRVQLALDAELWAEGWPN